MQPSGARLVSLGHAVFAVLCPRPNRYGFVLGVNLESRGLWQTGVHLIKVMVRARGVDSDTPPLKEGVALCVCVCV